MGGDTFMNAIWEKHYENTFVIPFIRNDFIVGFLDSLYKFTDPESFRVITIDQTPSGMYNEIKDKTHFYIRPYRNLGFGKAMNTGIKLAETEYVSCYNDDVEFIHKSWWDGIKQQFEVIGPTCFCVNPMSPKEAAWGYGHKAPNGRVLTADGRGVVWVKDGKALDLEESRTEEGYQWLINNVHGWVDGIALWGATFKREIFNYTGLFDERFYPGGGEDYDLNARAYDKEWNGHERYRMVATPRSWVYHHWGSSGSPDATTQSLEAIKQQGIVFNNEYRWNNWTSLWTEGTQHPTLSRGRKGKVETVAL
jgi:GT2 family glycosyltransferase